MRRYLQLADGLFLDFAVTAGLAIAAFYFGHYVWGAIFATTFAFDAGVKARRILRRHGRADELAQPR